MAENVGASARADDWKERTELVEARPHDSDEVDEVRTARGKERRNILAKYECDNLRICRAGL